jgi:hypothetical protein
MYEFQLAISWRGSLHQSPPPLHQPGAVCHVTNTGGFLIGYRYSFNRWLAAEANYGYDRNTQIYFGNGSGPVQSNIHQASGLAVFRLPSVARLQPYALAGGKALTFDPTDNAGGSFTGATCKPKAHLFMVPVPTTR